MNRYLEKIAAKVDPDELAKRLVRRGGRIGKGIFGIGADLAGTLTGKKVKGVMEEGSRIWVKNPFTRVKYQESLPDYRVDELANLSDSKKIKHLSDRYGKNHEFVKRLKMEINKRDAMRLGVGAVGVGVTQKKLRDYLEERRQYNEYYNV